MAKPIPDGYHSVTPYVIVDDGNAAIGFYKEAFGATELLRLPMGDRIAHAEIRIGDSVVMLADEMHDMGLLGPKARGGCTAGMMIYVEDVDAAFPRAIAAGGKVEREVQDQFYGDRSGTLVDPFGHRWTLSTHVEDVPEEEMQRRMAAFAADSGST
ncbi:VOC family protein [Sphingosinicella rhizophila]|uniref:VOC family protein n=1 Tax=Sphingosinicella rhizophila TaxID=3050082 RepID=A0ABU3Q3Q4_9SPHN|nr:VOC family protein [Sphingosinicella sp. GR2756]MDT9598031.1 VOC family protein [Sphingosinicella sp. GR2756]